MPLVQLAAALTIVSTTSVSALVPDASANLHARAETSAAAAVPRPPKWCTRKWITWSDQERFEQSFKPGNFCVIDAGKSPGFLIFQKDGNLVHYGGNPRRSLWASHTENVSANRLQMQADGNVVIYRNSKPLWSTGTRWENRPRGTDFMLGVGFLDRGRPESASVMLIVDPRWNRARPIFRGKNTAWTSAERWVPPPDTATIYGKFGPKDALGQERTKMVATYEIDAVTDVVCEMAGGKKGRGAICDAIAKIGGAMIKSKAAEFFEKGDCLSLSRYGPPSRVPYPQFNCRELVRERATDPRPKGDGGGGGSW